MMVEFRLFSLIFLMVGGLNAMGQHAVLPALPDPAFNLVLKAPVDKWDEAIPLGNGLMGGLLWGEGNIIRLSLDRGDLWDERTHGEKEWWKKYTYQKRQK